MKAQIHSFVKKKVVRITQASHTLLVSLQEIAEILYQPDFYFLPLLFIGIAFISRNTQKLWKATASLKSQNRAHNNPIIKGWLLQSTHVQSLKLLTAALHHRLVRLFAATVPLPLLYQI